MIRTDGISAQLCVCPWAVYPQVVGAVRLSVGRVPTGGGRCYVGVSVQCRCSLRVSVALPLQLLRTADARGRRDARSIGQTD